MKGLRLLAGLAGLAFALYGIRKGFDHGGGDEWSAQESRSARAFKHVS
jgi:hypothetical protein